MTPIFASGEALTFADVSIAPGYSELLPADVSVKTEIAQGLSLSIPFMSAAMDTVTEHQTAISMAQHGGLGVIHKNMSIERQAEEVAFVKKYEAGIVLDPITIDADKSAEDALKLMEKRGVSGFPVMDAGKLVGIVTRRDLSFASSLKSPVSSVMVTQLITARENESPDQYRQLMQKHRIEKLPLVDRQGKLCGLVTMKDLQKIYTFPDSIHDSKSRLLCAAAIGPSADLAKRVDALMAAGVDVLVVDTAHGHSKGVIEAVRFVRKHAKDVIVIAGNIVTAEAGLALADAGVHGVKVGVGPGSICTTRMVAGVGVPQLTAVWNVSQALKKRGVPVIADGGIQFSGDVVKALGAGASAVMLGSLFAGTDEAPGERVLYQGRVYKVYRGMGSLTSMSLGSKDRYAQASVESDKLVPEGIEGRVPYRGALSSTLYQLVGGLRSGMGYVGAANIRELSDKAQFVRITGAGWREGHVHDITITKEAPNYHANA